MMIDLTVERITGSVDLVVEGCYLPGEPASWENPGSPPSWEVEAVYIVTDERSTDERTGLAVSKLVFTVVPLSYLTEDDNEVLEELATQRFHEDDCDGYDGES